MKQVCCQVTLVFTILCLSGVFGIGLNTIRFREKLEKLKYEKNKKQAKENFQKYNLHQKYGDESTIYVPGLHFQKPYPDQYFAQPLDHFDPQIQGMYKQRFWVNADHWKSQDGPVFLYIGGEGALNSEVVQAGEHFDLAVKYGALILAVEHRYYGNSINKDGLQLKNLQFLSSQQALADLSTIHSFISGKYHLSEKNTWICYGGSYPGALSAWFRIKYPHLVYGAVASSAPIHAEVNFEGYNEVVKNSLSDPVVNGSVKCSQNIKEAFKQVDLMIHNKQFTQLSKDFKSCTVVKELRDINQFVSNLADIFMSTVQYNGEMIMDIDTLCTFMTRPSTPYENLKALITDVGIKVFNDDCTDNTWASFIKMLENTTGAESGVGFRQWIYQTCTQFGYYQSCDPNTTCVFSRYMTTGMSLEICAEVFQVQPPEVYERVAFSNAYYGGSHPSGTRILFVNGSIDPWHALSILKNISSTEIAIYINGTAHCANMAGSDPTDPPALVKARQKIDKQVGQWLSEAHSQNKDTKLYFKGE